MEKSIKKTIGINFYSVVSVLTFLIMGVGATFAYFNAIAQGEEMPISTSSIYVRMNLNILPLYNGKLFEETDDGLVIKPFLPTNDDDIFKAFENKCLDYYGNGACLAYTVQIENIGMEQSGHIIFNTESAEFTNLKYLVLDNNNNYEPLILPTLAVNNDINVEEDDLGTPIETAEGEAREVTLLIWLSNVNEQQDHEQGATFVGQVTYISNMGAKITGTISDTV